MRNAIDSFLKFLSDNLVGVTVHAMRFDKSKPDSADFKMNALNVHFLNLTFDTGPSSIQASLDLIYDKELDAVSAAEAVITLLNSAAQCPKKNYTNPASPVAVNGWLSWGTKISFRPIVSSTEYAHFNSTMSIKHYHS